MKTSQPNISFISYFNPLSSEHQGVENFQALTTEMKVVTVILTTFAALLSLPLLGLGGLAVFRYLSREYSVIDPTNTSTTMPSKITAIKTHRVTTQPFKLTREEWNEILKSFDGKQLYSSSLVKIQKATHLCWEMIREARQWSEKDLENLIQLCTNLQEVDLTGYYQFAASHFSADGLNPKMESIETALAQHPNLSLIWWGKTSYSSLGTPLWLVSYFNQEFVSIMKGMPHLATDELKQYLGRLAEFPCNIHNYFDSQNGVEFTDGIARILDYMPQLKVFYFNNEVHDVSSCKCYTNETSAEAFCKKLLNLNDLQKVQLPKNLEIYFCSQIAKSAPQFTTEQKRYLELMTHYNSDSWPANTDHITLLKMTKNLTTLNLSSLKEKEWTIELCNQIKSMKNIKDLEISYSTLSVAKNNARKGNKLSEVELITLEIVQNLSITSANNAKEALEILKLTPNVRKVTMIQHDLDENVASVMDGLKNLEEIKFDGGTVRFSEWDKPSPDHFREAIYSGKTNTPLFRVARLALSGDVKFNRDFEINDKDLANQQQMIEALKEVKGKKCLRFSEVKGELSHPAPWIELCKSKGWEVDPFLLDGKNATVENLTKLEDICVHTLILKDAKNLDKGAVELILTKIKPTNLWFQGETPQWSDDIWKKWDKEYKLYRKNNNPADLQTFLNNPKSFGTCRFTRKKECKQTVSRNGYIGKVFHR